MTTTIIYMEKGEHSQEAWSVKAKESDVTLVVSIHDLPSKVRKALEGRTKVFFESAPAPGKPFPYNIKRQAPWQEGW